MIRNTRVFFKYNPLPSKRFFLRVVKSHFQPTGLPTVCFKPGDFGNRLVNLHFKRHTYSTLTVHIIIMFICINLLKMTAYVKHKNSLPLTRKRNKNMMKETRPFLQSLSVLIQIHTLTHQTLPTQHYFGLLAILMNIILQQCAKTLFELKVEKAEKRRLTQRNFTDSVCLFLHAWGNTSRS